MLFSHGCALGRLGGFSSRRLEKPPGDRDGVLQIGGDSSLPAASRNPSTQSKHFLGRAVNLVTLQRQIKIYCCFSIGKGRSNDPQGRRRLSSNQGSHSK